MFVNWVNFAQYKLSLNQIIKNLVAQPATQPIIHLLTQPSSFKSLSLLPQSECGLSLFWKKISFCFYVCWTLGICPWTCPCINLSTCLISLLDWKFLQTLTTLDYVKYLLLNLNTRSKFYIRKVNHKTNTCGHAQ